MTKQTAKTTEKLTRKAFALQLGVSPSYITKLSQAGRLVFTENGRHVLVEASLQRIEDTRDPGRDDVVDRHTKDRAKKRKSVSKKQTRSHAPGEEHRKIPLFKVKVAMQRGAIQRFVEILVWAESEAEAKTYLKNTREWEEDSVLVKDEEEKIMGIIKVTRLQDPVDSPYGGECLPWSGFLDEVPVASLFYGNPSPGQAEDEEKDEGNWDKWLAREKRLIEKFNAARKPLQTDNQHKKQKKAVASYSESRAFKEHYSAQTAKEEYEKLVGTLCETGAVHHAAGKAGTITRAIFENLADQIAPTLAAESSEERIHALLVEQIEQALHDVADRTAAAIKAMTEN